MEDNYEENMIKVYGERNWNRAVALFEALVGDYPDFSQAAECDDVRKIAEGLNATEERATLAVAADKPNLPTHHWDVLVSRISDVFEGVRAEHLEVKDNSLVFYAGGQVLVAYGPGTWFTVSKTAHSEII